jgi:hypothetical protein
VAESLGAIIAVKSAPIRGAGKLGAIAERNLDFS